MKAMSPLYSVWRWLKLPIPQILASQSQSDPNNPRRKKARCLPERPSQQRRPISPCIVRHPPVRERKRQPEQVPGNGALGGHKQFGVPQKCPSEGSPVIQNSLAIIGCYLVGAP